MAEAYGKLTGRPGIVFVTRGPGATNASIGVHTGMQDSTPMILFIGQVGSDTVEREGFQEIDFRRMYAQMSKWVASIDRADRVPELVSRAFHTAVAGRPGPVVLALPEDMLTAVAQVADTNPYRRVAAHPGAEAMAQLRAMLARSSRPLAILGGNGWSRAACEDLKAFIVANGLPAGRYIIRITGSKRPSGSSTYSGQLSFVPEPGTLALLGLGLLGFGVARRRQTS